MPFCNYHSHTVYSDGKLMPEDHIIKAIESGMTSFGFSDHAPVPFTTIWCMKTENLLDYIQQIEQLKNKYQGQIEIYIGLEIDYIENITGSCYPLFRDLALDYRIGSVHFIDKLPNGYPWTIDGDHAEFARGLRLIHGDNIRKAILKFYEASREMIKEDKPDIIGHLDKIKMHNLEGCYFSEDEPWYQEQVQGTLDEIKQAGCIVEVNTRGLYRNDIKDIFPGKRVLKEIFKKNIPIILSSDSHHPNELTKCFSETAIFLKDIGFKELMVLRKGTWQAEGLV